MVRLADEQRSAPTFGQEIKGKSERHILLGTRASWLDVGELDGSGIAICKHHASSHDFYL